MEMSAGWVSSHRDLDEMQLIELPGSPSGQHGAYLVLIPAHIDGLGDGLDGQEGVLPEEAVVWKSDGVHEGEAQPANDAADSNGSPLWPRHVSNNSKYRIGPINLSPKAAGEMSTFLI
ncbi:hypothetical protein PGQ11_003875 [Apiospora arundinis]|uniref:Uncharacterized protein n=1 Tax=Apiospora arundinis TaxID=335852 RepID=A0ABR2J6F1_9PEZI